MSVLRRRDPGRSDQVPLLRQHARRAPPRPPTGSTELVDRRRGAPVHPLGLEVPPRVRTGLLRDLGPPGRPRSGLALPQDRRRVAGGLALVLRQGAAERGGGHRRLIQRALDGLPTGRLGSAGAIASPGERCMVAPPDLHGLGRWPDRLAREQGRRPHARPSDAHHGDRDQCGRGHPAGVRTPLDLLNHDVAPPSEPPITPQASATRVPVTGSGPIHRWPPRPTASGSAPYEMVIDETTIAPSITTAKTTPAAAPTAAEPNAERSDADPAHRPPTIVAIAGTSRKARYPGGALPNATSPLDMASEGNRP